MTPPGPRPLHVEQELCPDCGHLRAEHEQSSGFGCLAPHRLTERFEDQSVPCGCRHYRHAMTAARRDVDDWLDR